MLSSLAGIAIGLAVFFFTDMSALALLYVIGAYALTLGIFTICGALRLQLDDRQHLLGLTGLVSIPFGVLMIAEPGDGALVLLALIAAYSLVIGIAELTIAIGLAPAPGQRLARLLRTAGPQASH